jgi:hypothetical protein
MTNQKKTPDELSFDEEVEAFLNMDPNERSRMIERQLAERIVYHERRKRTEQAAQDDARD